MAPSSFTVLYDSACPFCRAEVRWLLRRAPTGALAAEDIADPRFDPGRFGLTRDEVVRELCGVRSDGVVTRGMESIRACYRAAGLGWLVAWTEWPGFRRVADAGYRLFARYRVPLGRWITGERCDSGACGVPDR